MHHASTDPATLMDAASCEVPRRSERLFEELASHLSLDNNYRANHLSLTASENYPSKITRLAGCALHGSFYHYSPPYETDDGEWTFPDSGTFAALSSKVSALGCSLFEAQTFDWRPNGGSVAEQAILLGTCRRGDAFVHFSHANGGHFALEQLASAAGIAAFHIPVRELTQLIDVDQLAQLIKQQPPIRLVILDQSFKLRWQPIAQIRAALPETVLLTYDASHDAALILGNVFPQPLLLGVDVVHGTTHKTIPGPQKGFVAFRDRDHPCLRPISNWVCPHFQSNSHAELMMPMLLALTEMNYFGADYARQITANAVALARALVAEDITVAGESFGFTETHQVHVVIGSAEAALRIVKENLASSGIRANNIAVPGTNGQHGLRLGTQALTRRGMKEADMREIACFLGRAIRGDGDGTKLRSEVAHMLDRFPLDRLAFSLDERMSSRSGQRFSNEVLGC